MGIRLAMCRGHEGPTAVIEGWKSYLSLPSELQLRLWQVVLPGILTPGDPTNQARVEAFVNEDAVLPEQSAGMINAGGFVLTQACAQDLSPEALRHDLHLLSDGEAEGSAILLSVYGTEKQRVREAFLRQTLADHGNVLVSLDWRIDQVSASNRGARLEAPVVFLTLAYITGEERRRISLQVTPEGLRDLRQFLSQFD